MRKSTKVKTEGSAGGDLLWYCIAIGFLLLFVPCLCLGVWAIVFGVTWGVTNGGSSSVIDPNLQKEVDYVLEVLDTCNITNSTCPTDTNITGLEIQVQNNTEILAKCNLTLDECGGVQGPPGANGTCTDEQCNSTTLRQDIDYIENILDTCNISNSTCPDMCWTCPVLLSCVRPIALFEPRGAGTLDQDLGFTRLGTGAMTITELGNYGDCRGDYAIDFQRFRGSSDQVALGTQSVILNGNGNKNSGAQSTIANGLFGLIESAQCFIGSGISNRIEGTTSAYSAIVDGADNTIVNSQRSVIVGGANSVIANSTVTMLYGDDLLSISDNTKPVVIIGRFNDPTVTHVGEQTMFAIGAGDDDLSRMNAMTVSDIGHIRLAPTGSVTIGGAFMMSTWMEHEEVRRLKWGSTVILMPDGRFREALPGERPDFVVVPPNAGFVSNSAEQHWHQKYILDEKTLVHELNPHFDPQKPYTPRSVRPEWHVVSRSGFVEVLNRAAKNYEKWIHLKDKKSIDPLKSWWYIP